jgi:hypothetical protein
MTSDETAAYVNFFKIRNGNIVQSFTTEIKKILENYKKIVPFLFQLGKGKVIFIWGSVAITAVIPTISTILMQYMINYIQMENREFKQILVLFIFPESSSQTIPGVPVSPG